MKMLVAVLIALSSSAFAAEFMTGSYECVSKTTSEVTRTVTITSTTLGGMKLPVVEFKRGLINIKGIGSISKMNNDRGLPAVLISLPLGRTTHSIFLKEDGSLDAGDAEICNKF